MVIVRLSAQNGQVSRTGPPDVQSTSSEQVRDGFPWVVIPLGVVAVACNIFWLLFPVAIALGVTVIVASIVSIRRSQPGKRWPSVIGLALGVVGLVGGLIWLVLWWVVNSAFNGF